MLEPPSLGTSSSEGSKQSHDAQTAGAGSTSLGSAGCCATEMQFNVLDGHGPYIEYILYIYISLYIQI